jgi:hypothetical protein
MATAAGITLLLIVLVIVVVFISCSSAITRPETNSATRSILIIFALGILALAFRVLVFLMK